MYLALPASTLSARCLSAISPRRFFRDLLGSREPAMRRERFDSKLYNNSFIFENFQDFEEQIFVVDEMREKIRTST